MFEKLYGVTTGPAYLSKVWLKVNSKYQTLNSLKNRSTSDYELAEEFFRLEPRMESPKAIDYLKMSKTFSNILVSITNNSKPTFKIQLRQGKKEY